ncbi:hypothetical protein [Rhizobium sp. 2MFCol3.1]|uniref:hypothetical protein n=1 Tax=Rhizobium sp. 2MFCol3.1 TaxID=1246459 RepID=UPI001FD8DBCE|nr:hypothetical protein [Rhizobium sp. 2MFCol3.1]
MPTVTCRSSIKLHVTPMLSSDALFSELFTAVKKAALPHPTSSKFIPESWKAAVDAISEPSVRDANLFKSAIVIGGNLQTLRTKYLEKLFVGLTPVQAVAFAIADANRAWVIIRQKSQEAQSEAAAKSEAVYTSTMGRATLDVGPTATNGSADMLNTTFVDCIPHWFSYARLADTPSRLPFEYALVAPKAQYGFSLEHTFKEIWLQICWEPWSIVRCDSGWLVFPDEPNDRGLWSAWGWRDEALAYQHAINRLHFQDAEPEIPNPLLERTAVATVAGDGRVKIVTGPPTAAHNRDVSSAMITLETSYLGEFADDPISPSQPAVTLRKLELATRTLQDVAKLILGDDADVEYRTEEDIERISCAFPESELTSLLSEALAVPIATAELYLKHLVCNPLDDLGALFRNALWHRPLVASGSDQPLRIVAGSLVWGSPVRRFEHWLQEANKSKDPSDLSKTPLGLKYEAALRGRLSNAIAANPILAPASTRALPIPARQGGEEIDGVLRIGSTILVLEIKCFLSPSEPIERHNYLRKLEKACAQASRKAEWLEQNPGEIEQLFGKLPPRDQLRFVPLVVVNQSAGITCKFSGSIIVDALFLELFLGGGSIRTGAVRDFRKADLLRYISTQLYTTVDEAEAAIPSLFEHHPGLEPYKASVDWEQSTVPLHNGSELNVVFPVMSEAAFTASYPAVDAVLSRNE